jgi:hypothetical protein
VDEKYHMTELGLVSNFQQECGCSSEGPGAKCHEGKRLWRAMCKDSEKLMKEKITLKEADKSLEAWQEHLGA